MQTWTTTMVVSVTQLYRLGIFAFTQNEESLQLKLKNEEELILYQLL